SGERFGQTFRATGRGLAAVDVIYTTGAAHPPALPVTFRLLRAPGGEQIGPTRRCYGLPLAFQGRAAAWWSRDEALLTPGEEYYLEWECPGANTWQLNEDLPGHAWRDGQPLPDADLAMSIVEYDR